MTSLHEGFTVVIECHMCNTEHEIYVNEEDYWRWANRTPVQIAFPYLTADQREMFISQTCGSCWDSAVRFG